MYRIADTFLWCSIYVWTVKTASSGLHLCGLVWGVRMEPYAQQTSSYIALDGSLIRVGDVLVGLLFSTTHCMLSLSQSCNTGSETSCFFCPSYQLTLLFTDREVLHLGPRS